MKTLPAFNELCCKDELRPAMNYVYITKEKVVATDAHVMGWADTPEVFDEEIIQAIPEEGILIHAEDWKKMLKADVLVWKEDGKVLKLIHSKKRDELIEIEYQSEVGKYPNWSAVVPNMDSPMDTVELSAIALDPEKLMQVHKFFKPLLHKPGVRMDFYGASKAIRCTPRNKNEETSMEAIIMPLLLND